MAPEPALTLSYLNYLILTTVPTIFCQALILCESLRVLPGEVRMYSRIWKRKRINIAETLFLMIKYIALIAFICEAITDFTSGLLSPRGCLALTWIYEIGLYLTSTLISCALAWRCYVIFQRRHRVGIYLLMGLSTQLSMAMMTAVAQLKYTEVSEGYCIASDHDIAQVSGAAWYKKRGVWFLLYSFLFDGSLVTFASWRLIKCVRGPSGLQRISKLLFLNNVHFLCIVSFANLIEFIVFVFFSNKIPSLLPLTVVVEVILGMQLLISEQDAAHGYGKTWVSGGTAGGTTRNTTFPSSMPRTGHATSSHWTESKRGGAGTASQTSTQQQSHQQQNHQQTTSSFNSSTRRLSGGGNGLDGIRYDCTEEVLVDYDMTMTQLAPKEESHADQGTYWGDVGSPYQGGQEAGDRLAPPSTSLYNQHHSNSSRTALNTSPATGGSSNVASSRSPQGGGGGGGGVSIRDIRAKVSASEKEDLSRMPSVTSRTDVEVGHNVGQGFGFEGHDAGYVSRRAGGGDHGESMSSSARMHRTGSMSSFNSTCTCGARETREAIAFGAALSSPSEAARMNIHVVQHADHQPIEEVIPVNPDAPFADYQRPSIGDHQHGQSGPTSGPNPFTTTSGGNPYSNNPYSGRGGY